MFDPNYNISPTTAKALMRIEASRKAFELLPAHPQVLAGLRRTARMRAAHYSTQIEGNRLSLPEIEQVLEAGQQIEGRERDEAEVLGYFKALDEVEALGQQTHPLKERHIQKIHGLLMGAGKVKVKLTPWRDGQNIIRDSRSQRIVYMPPQAKDVSPMMADLVAWLRQNSEGELPVPVVAALAHYQIATIHPYWDGNGRLARLLATLLIQRGDYGLKGIFSLDEYYADDLNSYYKQLSLGPSHNYYEGRCEVDLSAWVEYFCQGMALAVQRIEVQAKAVSAGLDQGPDLRDLDGRQRKALGLFDQTHEITSKDIAELFNLKPRSARHLASEWVEDGFLVVVNPSKKSRTYGLNKR